MGLGTIERARKYYLSISDGKVVHREDGKEETYSYVEGTLVAIYKRERTFKGETVLYWYVDVRGEKGELYSISFPYKSGTFKSIVLDFASDPAIALSTVKIEPYKKGDFTKVVTSSNGRRLDWITKELPPVEELRIAGQIVKDDTKRMAYIESLVERINNRLK